MKKNVVVVIIILILLVLGGWMVFFRNNKQSTELIPEPTSAQSFLPIGDDVQVDFKPNSARTKATLSIRVSNGAGVNSLEYEVLYETDGLVKGVNSGSTPIEIDPKTGKVERELDFGTCSSGVCRYDKNVGTITLIVRFDTTSGNKIFKKEYN